MTQPRLSYAKWFDRACGDITRDLVFLGDVDRLAPPGPVLDIGCGGGRILKAGLSRDLILLDRSPEFLDIAREAARGRPGTTFLQADALKIPLPDRSVAAICLLNNTLTELSPLAFAMAEIVRVLMPGGILFSLTRNPDCPTALLFGPGVVAIDGASYYSAFESYRMPDLGRYHFETHVKVRGTGGEEHRFYIPQVYPPIEFLRSLAARLGLEEVAAYSSTDRDVFDPNASARLFWLARKVDHLRLAAKFPENFALYERMAPRYDEIAAVADANIASWIRDRLAARCGVPHVTLDLACGTGSVGRLLRGMGEGGRIYGVDFSPGMLATARKTGAYDGLIEFDLCQGLPLVEESFFDRIVLASASEFLADLPGLLAASARALVRHGEMLLTFEKTGPDASPSGRLGPGGYTKFHYDEAAVRGMLASARLDITSFETRVGYHSPTLGRDIEYFFVSARRSSF